MKYVIRRGEYAEWVADRRMRGVTDLYTADLCKARLFGSKLDAERQCLGGDYVETLDSACNPWKNSGALVITA